MGLFVSGSSTHQVTVMLVAFAPIVSTCPSIVPAPS